MEAILMGQVSECFAAGNDFERAFFCDAVRLVMECHMHKCGPSCFKYTSSKTKFQLCRHLFYHVVTITSITPIKNVRLRGKSSPPNKPLDTFRLRGKERFPT